MKHIIILISLILTSAFSHAQNIVPNFSFEVYDTCPNNFNESSYEYSLGCVGWGHATTGTADYYNACDTTAVSIGLSVPYVGVPSNQMGFQAAYEGDAYTGIVMYDSLVTYYKEYLITSIPALEIDTAYKVTIHVSLADSSRFATDAMGVLFTTHGSPNPYAPGTLIATPQIDYTSYGVISDTINWTTLSGIFIADSAYTSLIIGGFKNASEMTVSAVNNTPKRILSYISYYYIDNVVVEKLSATNVTSINNSTNVSICPNPFSDRASLLFNNPYGLNYSFVLFNIQGQVVQHIDNFFSDRITIERNNLPAGFYYYQLRNSNNIIANGKLIIK